MLPLAISPVTVGSVMTDVFGPTGPFGESMNITDAETNVCLKRIVLYTLYPALRLGAFFVIGGLFSKDKPLGAAIKFSVLCFAVSLIQFFTSNFDFAFLIQTPSTYQISEVMDTYVYMQGLQSNSFSYGCAVDVIKILLQLVPTVLAALLLVFVFKNKPDTEKRLRGIPSVGISVLPLALLVCAVLFKVLGYSISSNELLGGHSALDLPLYGIATVNSIGNSFEFAIIAVLIIILLAYAVSNAKTVGVIVCCLMILFSSGNMISSFLLTKFMGLINTDMAVVLGMLKVVPLIAIICALIHTRRKGLLVGVGTGMAVFSMMFVYGWGELHNSIIYLNDESRYPLAVIERQMIWEGQFRSEVFILVPIVVLAVFIMGAAVIDWLLNKFKDENVVAANKNIATQIPTAQMIQSNQM